MPYKLYYFPEGVEDQSIEVPISCDNIDLADTNNQTGDADHPIYLDANGNTKAITLDLNQLCQVVNELINISFNSSTNTLTITYNAPNLPTHQQ